MIDEFKEVIDYIAEAKMLSGVSRLGVAVSGGEDSVCLLHFLNELSGALEIEIVALHVNHKIRETADRDARFVQKLCRELGVECKVATVDVPTFAKENKLGIEAAARILRYNAFEEMAKKHKLDKIALAHHQSDQAETVLLHILRGSGLSGAQGMEAVRGIFIRPFLKTAKQDIIKYNYQHGLNHVDDETNADNNYARNFLRNEIFPLLKRQWRGIEATLSNFAEIAREDNEFIGGLVPTNEIIRSGNNVKIPLAWFEFKPSIINRVIAEAFKKLAGAADLESKHIALVIETAKTGENGAKIDLPKGVRAIKEYECLTLVKKEEPKPTELTYSFKVGKISIPNFGVIITTKTVSYRDASNRGLMVVDADKLPKNAKWRFRKDGDVFTKFGGGTATVNKFLGDKKVPARLRDKIPMLCLNNEVFIIGGLEIS
ncbi:MAG: tRNA lysidine(34) synthetase TilS, partial [Christensenellaceae bacterium]|nr:tRNA lysidine(34) synthetase TilS [Christensenellaceae bacterium]